MDRVVPLWLRAMTVTKIAASGSPFFPEEEIGAVRCSLNCSPRTSYTMVLLDRRPPIMHAVSLDDLLIPMVGKSEVLRTMLLIKVSSPTLRDSQGEPTPGKSHASLVSSRSLWRVVQINSTDISPSLRLQVGVHHCAGSSSSFMASLATGTGSVIAWDLIRMHASQRSGHSDGLVDSTRAGGLFRRRGYKVSK